MHAMMSLHMIYYENHVINHCLLSQILGGVHPTPSVLIPEYEKKMTMSNIGDAPPFC